MYKVEQILSTVYFHEQTKRHESQLKSKKVIGTIKRLHCYITRGLKEDYLFTVKEKIMKILAKGLIKRKISNSEFLVYLLINSLHSYRVIFTSLSGIIKPYRY